MSGHRQAAAALHALAEGDRAAILDELPEADQRTLRAFLAELNALGFDGEVLAAASATPPMAAAAGATGAQARLDAASPANMFAILEYESSAMVAQCLNLHAWSWSEELVHLFPQQKRESIRAARAQHTTAAPARTAFLLRALAERLADLGPQAARSPVQAALDALRNLVASWTR